MKLSIIIVSYNHFDYLKTTIDSVINSRIPFSYEIIVVDNRSSDDIHAFLGHAYPDIIIIKNKKNVGFSRACNQGCSVARGEYLLFLNNDTIVFEETLQKLAAKMDSNPQIGALGPLVVNPDRSFQLSFGQSISIFSELFQKIFALKFYSWRMGFPPRRDIYSSVGWLSGCCLITRRKLFPDNKVFDEEMFLYFEDHDLCLRVSGMGKKIMYWSEPAILHYGGMSVGKTLSRAQIEYRRSQLYIYRKYQKKTSLLFLKVYLTLKFHLKLILLSWKHDRLTEERKKIYLDILALL
jgi:GT2 family glycosyltransferase